MDILLDYPEYAVGYSIGILVFGIFTHKVMKWFGPQDIEDEPLQSNLQNGLLTDMVWNFLSADQTISICDKYNVLTYNSSS